MSESPNFYLYKNHNWRTVRIVPDCIRVTKTKVKTLETTIGIPYTNTTPPPSLQRPREGTSKEYSTYMASPMMT